MQAQLGVDDLACHFIVGVNNYHVFIVMQDIHTRSACKHVRTVVLEHQIQCVLMWSPLHFEYVDEYTIDPLASHIPVIIQSYHK